MNKLVFTRFITYISILLFLTDVPAFSSSIIKTKEPYSVEQKTRYKNIMSIAFLPIKGTVESEREYLKEIMRSLIIDSILSYKKYRMPDIIKDFKRNSFDSAKENNPADETGNDLPADIAAGKSPDEKAAGFLSPQFIEDDILKNAAAENLKTDPVLSRADIIIIGEINQKGDDIDADLEVYNNIYGMRFLVRTKGNIKNINKLRDDIFSEIIKSIIIDCAYLDITSPQAGSMIYIDGRYFGKTDRRGLILEAGEHTIILRKDNFLEKKFTLALNRDQAESITVSLDGSGKIPVCRLMIATSPEKAGIYLDSNFMGYGPLAVDDLMPGTYRLRVAAPGRISKFETLVIRDGEEKNLSVTLEEGSDSEYYFERTDFYINIFKGSLGGCALSAFSFIYFGMKIEDEKAKVRGFQFADPDNHTAEENAEYARLKEKTNDRVDRYALYKNISLYAAIACFISAGAFFYLDVSQYDIDIALYNPGLFLSQKNYAGSEFRLNDLRDIGVEFSIRF